MKDRYILGSTPTELKRLMLQAKILRPITERLLREAGVRQGMRVLDLGCGPGDVSLLAAEIVRPSGYVLGIDQAQEAVAAAEGRAAGVGHVDFRLTSVQEFSSAETFDAVIGRYVLLHQSDPTAFIRTARRHLRPGGIVAFHEISPRHGFHSSPPVQVWDSAAEWIIAAFSIDSPGRDAASRLVEHFVNAGLQCPTLFAETLVGGGENSPLYAWTAETVRSTIPELLALGIAEEEISIDTLEDRLRSSVVEAKAQVNWPAQICAWAQL
ncbi:MAG: class SAM-dependent methyltransferase [Rhodospirillales bacterium]|nr:class SAM-dependent methyltransferase [Rhodospirillales bacterium]